MGLYKDFKEIQDLYHC